LLWEKSYLQLQRVLFVFIFRLVGRWGTSTCHTSWCTSTCTSCTCIAASSVSVPALLVALVALVGGLEPLGLLGLVAQVLAVDSLLVALLRALGLVLELVLPALVGHHCHSLCSLSCNWCNRCTLYYIKEKSIIILLFLL
jgi:hypothetical protein